MLWWCETGIRQLERGTGSRIHACRAILAENKWIAAPRGRPVSGDASDEFLRALVRVRRRIPGIRVDSDH